MNKAILLKPNSEIEIIDFVGGLDWYYKYLECHCIDIVKVGKFLMVVDDEGLLIENPQINLYASLLYGYTICGNVLVVKDGFNEDGEPDCVGMNEDDLNKLNNILFEAIFEQL